MGCILNAFVRNKETGQVAESKLFKDLRQVTSYKVAKQYYDIAINDSEWNSSLGDLIKRDENGEPTLASLLKYTDLGADIGGITNALNKSIGSGKSYSKEEAWNKVKDFNANSAQNDNYMAIVEYLEDGKYTVKVQKRNSFNESKFVNEIHERRKRDRIIKRLKEVGVNVEFLEPGAYKFKGKYSTVNATQTADGLYNLIQVVLGENANITLSEEVGHFIVGGLGLDNPLLNRLFSSLDEKSQRKILGKEYDNISNENTRLRECAGKLIGQCLAEQTGITQKPLIQRIIDSFKKMLNKISLGTWHSIMGEPLAVSQKIAEGFLDYNWEGNLQDALLTEETLYSSANAGNYKKNINYELYRIGRGESIVDIHEAAVEFAENISGISKKYTKLIAPEIETLEDMMEDIVNNPGIREELYIPVLLETVVKLAKMAEEIIDDKNDSSLLSKITIARLSNPLDYSRNRYKYAKDLQVAGAFLQYFNSIQETVKTLFDFAENTGNSEVISTVEQWRSASGGFFQYINSALQKFEEESKYMVLGFFEQIYGKSTIKIVKRKLFKKSDQKQLDKLIEENGDTVPLHKVIFKPTELERLVGIHHDISWVAEYLSMAHNNPSIMNQLLHKSYMDAQQAANSAYLEYKNKIQNFKEEFEKTFKKYGITESDLYERDENGKLTSNLLNEYNYDAWEQARLQEKLRLEEEFRNNNPNMTSTLSYKLELKSYVKTGLSRWNSIHSKAIDTGDGKFNYVPNKEYNGGIYRSKRFDELNAKTEGKLESYMRRLVELKQYMEKTLVGNYGIYTHPYRAPQYRASFSNIAENKKGYTNALAAGIGAVREWWHNLWYYEDTDTESGYVYPSDERNYKYYAPGARYAKSWYKKGEKTSMYRLPIHGVNRIKNTDKLSTDLFGSLERYAADLSTYAAQERVLDTLEIGRHALKAKHKEHSNKRELYSYENTMKYSIYRETLPKINPEGKTSWEKVISHLKGIGVLLMLAYKAGSQTKNFFANTTRRVAIAANTKNHNLGTGVTSTMEYIKNWGDQNVVNAGKHNKNDFLSKLNRRFRMRNTLTEDTATVNYRENRFVKLVKGLPYLGFSADDHYHQSVSLISNLQETKVFKVEYNDDGTKTLKEISLYDLYKNQKLNKNEELSLPENVYIDIDGLEEEAFLNDVLEAMKPSENSLLGNQITPEQIDKIKELYKKYRGYSNSDLTDLENRMMGGNIQIISIIEELKPYLKINELFESKITQKAQKEHDLLFGAYRSNTMTQIQRDSVLRSTTGMKGYKFGYFNTYYLMPNSTDIIEEEDMESWAQSVLKLISSTARGTFGGKDDIAIWDALLILLPMSGRIDYVRNKLTDAQFTSNQIDNIMSAKALTIVFALLHFIGIAIWNNFGPEDDEEETLEKDEVTKILDKKLKKADINIDKMIHQKLMKYGIDDGYTEVKSKNWEEKNKLMGYIYYLVRGVEFELASFIAPQALLKEWRDFTGLVIPGITQMTSLTKGLIQMALYRFADEDNKFFYYQQRGRGHEKGDPKYIQELKKVLPIFNNEKLFRYPWDTTEDLEYRFWENK